MFRRQKQDIPDSAVMKPRQYALFAAVWYLAGIGLLALGLGASIGWIPNGNVVMNGLVFIGALISFWLGYLGTKTALYVRRRQHDRTP